MTSAEYRQLVEFLRRQFTEIDRLEVLLSARGEMVARRGRPPRAIPRGAARDSADYLPAFASEFLL